MKITTVIQEVFAYYALTAERMCLGKFELGTENDTNAFQIRYKNDPSDTPFTIHVEEVETAELANDGVPLDRGQMRKKQLSCMILTAYYSSGGGRSRPPESHDVCVARVPFRNLERSFHAILHKWLEMLIKEELARIAENVPQMEEYIEE